jgi:hypothetical protein
MRILSVVSKNYYGYPKAVEPMYLYFTVPLREMGYEVFTFDHYEAARVLGRERATESLLKRIKGDKFDLVLYQTSGHEPVETEALCGLATKVCIAAWNSDDDWQWDTTRRLARHFTFMITTYPHVYEENRSQYVWGARVVGKLDELSQLATHYGVSEIVLPEDEPIPYSELELSAACKRDQLCLSMLGLYAADATSGTQSYRANPKGSSKGKANAAI